MDVHQRELRLRVWRKELLLAVVEAAEVVGELDGGCREVHDKVGDGGRHGHADRFRGRLCRVSGLLGGVDNGAVAALGCLENQVRSLMDEFMAVKVEGLDVLRDLWFRLLATSHILECR